MGGLGIRTGSGSPFTSGKKKLPCPYLYISRFGGEIALMVTCLEPGPLPIVLSDSGILKQVGSCVTSALELAKLLRVYQLKVMLSETDHRTMREVNDILEVLL